MIKIFISYRREDSVYICDRVYAFLTQQFGQENIFRDTSSILPGANFRKRLEEAVNNCDIVLVIMGKRWLTLTDEFGRRRIDHPDDWVALEIETALTREIHVIPLLVENIRMPHPDALPNSLADLPSYQALELRPGDDFERDIQKLGAAIRSWLVPVERVAALEPITKVHEAKFVTKSPIHKPDTTQGSPLSMEEYNELMEKIHQILYMDSSVRWIPGEEFIENVEILGVDVNNFQVLLDQKRDDIPVLVVSLIDKQSRLPQDALDWKLNLKRFSRRRDNFIDFYHNGDNSLQSPYREGSYGRNAPYSIVRYAIKQFPELQSTNPDLVYLGSLSLKSLELAIDTFRDVRRRLAIYRFARWLWLWDHPRRQK